MYCRWAYISQVRTRGALSYTHATLLLTVLEFEEDLASAIREATTMQVPAQLRHKGTAEHAHHRHDSLESTVLIVGGHDLVGPVLLDRLEDCLWHAAFALAVPGGLGKSLDMLANARTTGTRTSVCIVVECRISASTET